MAEAEKKAVFDPTIIKHNDKYVKDIATKLAEESGLVLTRYIAKGTFGVVYEAKNKEGQVFAVKIPRKDNKDYKNAMGQDIAASDFIRENTNISKEEKKLFAVGKTEQEAKIEPLSDYLKGRCFIMKKREGDLATLIDQHPEISDDKDLAKRQIEQMTSMLTSLHKVNKVYPDFKLQNILYNKKKNLRLTDLASVVPEGSNRYNCTFFTPEFARDGGWSNIDNMPSHIVPHTKKSDSFVLGLAILQSTMGKNPKIADLLLSFTAANVYNNRNKYVQLANQAMNELYRYSKSIGYDNETATKICQLLEYRESKRTDVESLLPLLRGQNLEPVAQAQVNPQPRLLHVNPEPRQPLPQPVAQPVAQPRIIPQQQALTPKQQKQAAKEQKQAAKQQKQVEDRRKKLEKELLKENKRLANLKEKHDKVVIKKYEKTGNFDFKSGKKPFFTKYEKELISIYTEKNVYELNKKRDEELKEYQLKAKEELKGVVGFFNRRKKKKEIKNENKKINEKYKKQVADKLDVYKFEIVRNRQSSVVQNIQVNTQNTPNNDRGRGQQHFAVNEVGRNILNQTNEQLSPQNKNLQ
ncbi:MAG: hypothetical protein Ta2D_00780 [Rickettsiales bacterium]|nr:MAG: hypothetical protein Ta2D_00780 [Rickettsiales bacterium]